jgi:hypothetical protein
MKTTKTIAGIQFTNEGISIIRPYKVDDKVASYQFDEKLFTGEFVEQAKRLAKVRMANCYKKLHTNIATASHITPDVISWKGGHFSVPVWEALEGVLQIEDVRHLNEFQCQQLIRAMLIDKETSCWLYDYDSNWNQISNSDIRLSDGFKLFVTEHMLICKSQEFRG